jgi:hypothetical protein
MNTFSRFRAFPTAEFKEVVRPNFDTLYSSGWLDLPTMALVVNGWQMNTDTMGVYGDYYLKRAIIAMVGLGANQPNDAIYRLDISDADGKPLSGEHTYVLHFDKQELPPVTHSGP